VYLLTSAQPKYWCKFCSTYVKDTKFERAQHESTGRHQGNIQRSLRGLHREQEHEQRNKARAQAEVARLNGIVPAESKPTTSVATRTGGPAPTYEKRFEKKATVEDRKRQWEQLAAMGVALPDEARTDLALAGDWKTVSREVVGEVAEDGEFKVRALNKGVHKRRWMRWRRKGKRRAKSLRSPRDGGTRIRRFRGVRVGHLKRLSSESAAFKLAVVIGRKRKQNSAFLVRYLRVLLLRHVALIRKMVLPSLFGRRDGGIRYKLSQS
jgi:hypothetical protein